MASPESPSLAATHYAGLQQWVTDQQTSRSPFVDRGLIAAVATILAAYDTQQAEIQILRKAIATLTAERDAALEWKPLWRDAELRLGGITSERDYLIEELAKLQAAEAARDEARQQFTALCSGLKKILPPDVQLALMLAFGPTALAAVDRPAHPTPEEPTP